MGTIPPSTHLCLRFSLSCRPAFVLPGGLPSPHAGLQSVLALCPQSPAIPLLTHTWGHLFCSTADVPMQRGVEGPVGVPELPHLYWGTRPG